MDAPALLKKLAAHADPSGTTLTLALDLSKSGRLPAATRLFLKDQVYENLASEARNEKARDVLRKLARRVRDFVEKQVKPGTDGLYLVAGPGLWEAVELKLPLRNLVVVGRTSYLAPLVEALQRSPRAYAVELRSGAARIEELHLGERVERDRLEAAALPENLEHATAVHGGAERDLQQRRRNAAGKALAKEAAARVAALHRAAPAEIVLVTPPSEDFVSHLPAALRGRVATGGAEALEAAYEKRVAGDVREFQEARKRGLYTALGAREALESLASGNVERIFVDPDDAYPGVVCEDCGTRFPELHRRCPYCEGDVVAASMTQEVVASALARPALGVTFVRGGKAWLKELGGMAALLKRKGARGSRSGQGILARGS